MPFSISSTKQLFLPQVSSHPYNIISVFLFLKAITYLQSAYRLKGEDTVEAHDITEIAGVRHTHCEILYTILAIFVSMENYF